MINETNGLPDGWITAPLGEIIEIVRGISFTKEAKQSSPKEGYVACLRTTNVQREVDWSNLWFVPRQYVKRQEQLVQQQDILISTANSLELVGKVAQVKTIPHRATLGAFISLIRSASGINPTFTYYQLTASEFQAKIRSCASTTTNISNVSTAKLAELNFKIPPLPEQQRIVAKIEELFTKLDAGVEALKTARAQLGRYRQTILKAAVTGELTREWREAHRAELEPAADLLERILRERRAKWEANQLAKMQAAGKPPKNDDWKQKYPEPTPPDTSQLPELPEGWLWTSIEQLVDVGTGATPLRSNPNYYANGTIAWVTSGSLNSLFVDNADEYVTELALKETNVKVFPRGTLLVAMYGEGKTRGKVSELRIAATTNQACAALVFNGLARQSKSFLKTFLRKNYDDVRRLSSGGVQPNLNLSIIKETAVPFPSLTEQQQIISEVERLLSIADAMERTIEQSLRQAERMRQSILQQAFAGKLVPQDPSDEPAEVLLARFRAERAQNASASPKPRRPTRKQKQTIQPSMLP